MKTLCSSLVSKRFLTKNIEHDLRILHASSTIYGGYQIESQMTYACCLHFSCNFLESLFQGKEECFNATPVVKAEDQDRSAKSIVNYEIVEGEKNLLD